MKNVALLAVVATMIVGSTVFATLEGPSLTILWEDESGGSGEVFMGPDVLAQYAYTEGSRTEIDVDENESQEIEDLLQIEDSLDLQSFTIAYDEDPYVTGGFSVYNPLGVTQTYTFIFTSPVASPLTPTSLYGGSMSGSMTAGMSAPATVATVANTPLYWGMIDGAPFLPIYPDPTLWSVLSVFGSGSISAVTVPTTNVGPQVLNNISLQFKFSLTSDDTATMNGIFEVIPEPATMVLLSLGGLLLRKRK